MRNSETRAGSWSGESESGSRLARAPSYTSQVRPISRRQSTHCSSTTQFTAQPTVVTTCGMVQDMSYSSPAMYLHTTEQYRGVVELGGSPVSSHEVGHVEQERQHYTEQGSASSQEKEVGASCNNATLSLVQTKSPVCWLRRRRYVSFDCCL